MQNTLSLNKIISLFYSLAMDNPMVNEFDFGPVWNISKKNRRFPLAYLEPSSAIGVKSESTSSSMRTFIYSYNLYVFDKIIKGDDNYDELLSDTQYIIQSLITQIDQHPYYVDLELMINSDINWEPVQERLDENVNGWVANIQFKVPNRLTPCTTGQLPLLTWETQFGTASVEYRLIGPQGPTGPQGVQGVQGATGAGVQGIQGATGPQGDIGAQGSIGTQGVTGPQGVQGVTGPQGIQGLGFQGPTGPQGARGDQGTQGDFGPVGPAGLIWRGLWSSSGVYSENDSVGYASASWFVFTSSVGPTTSSPDIDSSHWALIAAQGAPGQQGFQGPTGPQGTQGDFGPQGVQGATGPQGVQGPIGEVGATGSQGPIGAQGVTGPQGLQGPIGAQGVTGPQGPIGAQGVTGPQGTQGTTGAQGATGSQGPIGAQGVTGPQGLQGPIGAQGVTGPQGPIGAQGVTGPQGTQGTTGVQGATGQQGPIGVQGVTGPQGLQGTTGVQGVIGPQGTQGATGVQGATGSMLSQITTTTTYTTSVTFSSSIADPTNRIVYNITAQSGALLFNATGSWTQSQLLMVRLKDNGTASTLSYSSGFTYGTSLVPPTTTTINKLQYLGFIYNAQTTKLNFVSYVQI